MDKFKGMSLFMSAVETGSFAAAAKKHATDPSNVSKAMKKLEEQLGVQLFYRSTRKLSLTAAGQKYADSVGHIVAQLQTVEDELLSDNDTPQGPLKVNLPVAYGRNYILPMIAKFKKSYPLIELDVSFNDHYVDMISEGVDVAIRSGSLADSRLVAQKLSPMSFVLCASAKQSLDLQDIFDGDQLNEEKMRALPWVQFRFRQTGRCMPIDFSYSGKHIQIKPSSTTIVDDGSAFVELCAEGVGLAMIPHFAIKSQVEAGNIKVLAKIDEFADSGVFIVYPKRQYLPQRSRAFIDFVKAELKTMGETAKTTWLDYSPHC